MHHIVERIKVLMLQKDMSQAQLASAIGVPESTVSGWFRKGKPPVKVADLFKISELFDVSMDYIWAGKKEEEVYRIPERYRHLCAIIDELDEDELLRLEGYIDGLRAGHRGGQRGRDAG